MQDIYKTLQQKAIAIDNKNKNTIAIGNDKIDYLLDEYKDLRLQKDTAWHAKVIKLIGTNKYEELARVARAEGRHPSKYMTFLINRFSRYNK